MQMGFSLSPMLEARPSLLQELRLCQELDMTLRMKLQDTFEYARTLHEASEKVKVLVPIGRYTILIDAALVEPDELGKIFEDEKFAGMIARLDERYLFFNKSLQAPESMRQSIPRLMAFHCLAAIKVPDFGDETGTLRQFQAIALEMAYAKTRLTSKRYADYEKWRPGIERTAFFERPDWKDIVDRTHERFRSLVEPLHRNAHRACFPVMMHGERFALTRDGTAVGKEGEIEVHRKRCSRIRQSR